MGDIVSLKKYAKKTRSKANTLCNNNHHKWVVCKKQQFDVKQGKLVTVYRCARCNKQKVTTH